MSLDSARDIRNREAMRAHDLDALICRLPENVLLLTGYWPLSSFAFVLYPRAGPVTLIALQTEVAEIEVGTVDEVVPFTFGVVGAPEPYTTVQRHLRDAVRAAGIERGRIGHEAGFEAIAPGPGAGEILAPSMVTHAMLAAAVPEATLVDATPALHAARARKTPHEIDCLRRANTIACFGLETFRAFYEPGRTEVEVAAQVEAAIMTLGTSFDGARHVRAWAQLMTGPEAARAYTMHPATSARTIRRGDLGVLELGTVADGYWSDLTRTRVAGGQVDARQAEMYDAILAAHEAVMARARPGMTGAEVDALARNAIEQRGLGHYFVHHTGHGLGFRYHEPIPFLHPNGTGMIEEGMVSSVEPGLYVQDWGGMRLEENVVFTDDGVELLSIFATSL